MTATLRDLSVTAQLAVLGLPKPLSFVRYARSMENNQWMSPEQLHRVRTAKLERLLSHATAHCSFYRETLGTPLRRLGAIRHLEAITDLPMITRSDVREHLDGMVDATRDRGALERRSTGGTTGVPMPFYVDGDYCLHQRALVARVYRTAGRNPFTPTVLVAGSPIDSTAWTTAAASARHRLRRTTVVPAFELTLDGLGRLADLLERKRPRFLIAYANALSLLARYCRSERRKLTVPAVIPLAELVTAAHREAFQSELGAETFELYGAREANGLAVECPRHAGLHIQEDSYVLEIVRGESPVPDGEVGEIVITDLENMAMPLIRYRIGDLGTRLPTPCGCGRVFSLMEVTHGRSLDVIVTKSGSLLPGEFFPHLFKEVDRDVERFHVRQRSLDLVEVDMVVREGTGGDLEAYLGKKIRERLGPDVRLDFRRVRDLQPGPSGKYRPTESDVGLPW